MFRVGVGQDSHKLISNSKFLISKSLILAGAEITKEFYLEADSEGDVIIHSLCNALSTAIGGGSLDTWAGEMFRNKIVDSREFLKVILKRVKDRGYKIGNVSVAVEAGKPKLENFREKMQQSLAGLLEVKADQIGISFTSGEALTSFGKGEGIQVFSAVLIEK